MRPKFREAMAHEFERISKMKNGTEFFIGASYPDREHYFTMTNFVFEVANISINTELRFSVLRSPKSLIIIKQCFSIFCIIFKYLYINLHFVTYPTRLLCFCVFSVSVWHRLILWYFDAFEVEVDVYALILIRLFRVVCILLSLSYNFACCGPKLYVLL